ncbi:hypothetical protein CHARACLAT_009029 [Characodon lateralis]|uniref:Uncharacterized protein n=1 Tax=Characodon lateralis TaxID=208331 RepID=A0ABU7E144_9TELE|nr:hypothetical protein [Characodon lateralis]
MQLKWNIPQSMGLYRPWRCPALVCHSVLKNTYRAASLRIPPICELVGVLTQPLLCCSFLPPYFTASSQSAGRKAWSCRIPPPTPVAMTMSTGPGSILLW